MSALTIYSDKDASQHQWHSTDAAEIAQQLNAKGVRLNAGTRTAIWGRILRPKP